MFHISLPTYVAVPNDCDVYDFQLWRANIIEDNVQINFNRSPCLKLKIMTRIMGLMLPCMQYYPHVQKEQILMEKDLMTIGGLA